jgi:hypothetical protein
MTEPASKPPRDNIFKHAAIAFAVTLGAYIGFYACDSRLRTRHGPWVVDFQITTNHEPLLVINEEKLGIRNVRILLAGEKATNAPATVRFESPAHLDVPYGRVRFHDLTYLPGTITLDLFGHEVEMLPRTLFLNTREQEWRNDALFVLSPTNKIPGLKDRDRKGRR